MLRTFRLSVIVFLIAAIACPEVSLAARQRKKRHARASTHTAILWDTATNRRYYDRNADKRVFPASTTKVLTAILVLEKLPLDQYVTVSARAMNVQPTKLNLMAGEQYRVRDLLYALLLKSANDAAIVLAEALAGSEANFVKKMNVRSRQLGATHSHFANPHGLPSRGAQYTTAADMALIFQEALKKDFFRSAIKDKYKVIYSKNGRRHFLKSHNKSLFLDWKRHVYGKTGYTKQAKSCFVGYIPKGNGHLIIAVFGSRKRWDHVKFIIERYGQINL